MKTIIHRQANRRLVLLASAAMGLLIPSFASAGGGTWIGGNGLWSDGANWSSNAPPTIYEPATFNAVSAYTVDFSATASTSFLRVEEGSVTLNLGSAKLTTGDTLGAYNTASLVIRGGSVFTDLEVTDNASLRLEGQNTVEGGTLFVQGEQSRLTVTGAGTRLKALIYGGKSPSSAASTISVTDGATFDTSVVGWRGKYTINVGQLGTAPALLKLNGGSFNLSSTSQTAHSTTLNIFPNGNLQVGSFLISYPVTTINLDGGMLSGGTLTMQGGTFNVSGGTLNIVQVSMSRTPFTMSDGHLEIESGSTADVGTFSMLGGSIRILGKLNVHGAGAGIRSGTIEIGTDGKFYFGSGLDVSGAAGAGTGPLVRVLPGGSMGASEWYGDVGIGMSGGAGTIEVDGGSGGGSSQSYLTIGEGSVSLNGVPVFGRGMLHLVNGGSQAADTLFIGDRNGIGTISIEGVNSRFYGYRGLYVGGYFSGGEGTMEIRKGARATFGNTFPWYTTRIGGIGQGTVIVAGGGARLEVQNRNLELGFNGALVANSRSVLSIEEGGEVYVADTLHTYPSGETQLNLNGGLLKTQSLNFQGDISRFHFNSGTLWLNGGSISNMGAGSLQVNGTLMGSGTINGNVVSKGEIAPGASPGTLNINGNLTLDEGASFAFELGSASDLLAISGQLIDGGMQPFLFKIAAATGFSPGTYTLLSFGSSQNLSLEDFTFSGTGDLQGHFILNDNSLQIAVVPEPVSFAFVAACGLLRRRARD